MVMDRAGWLWRRKSSDKSPGGSDNLVSVSSHSEQCSDDQVQHHALILYHLHLFHFIWAVWLQLLPFTFSSMFRIYHNFENFSSLFSCRTLIFPRKDVSYYLGLVNFESYPGIIYSLQAKPKFEFY